MDELVRLRDFRAGFAPPDDAVRERARRAWKHEPRPMVVLPLRRVGVRFAIAFVTVTAVVTTSVVVVSFLVDQRVADIPRVSLGKGVLQPVRSDDVPQNILVMGIDDRQPPDGVAPPRSDTVILLRVRRHSAEAVWFPRDLLVQIPGQAGSAPLGQAYMLGGPRLAIDTLKANFGVDVNHYVELDMRGLRDIVDALGGIQVSFPEALRDERSGLQVAAGCARLDGDEALALVRSRMAEAFRDGTWQLVDVRSELDRVQRQAELVGVLQGALRARVTDQPRTLVRLVDAVLDHAKIDDSFDRQEIFRLVQVLVDIDASRFHAAVLPVALSTTDPGRLAVAAESAATLRQLGAAPTASDLPAVAPGDVDGLRPC
jgi:LCP family protein required for cell wall assembly